MTGKQAIFEYLKTHKTFCLADVSAFSGVSHTGINQAASDLARKGLLVVDGKVWRTVYYLMVTEDEKKGRRSTKEIKYLSPPERAFYITELYPTELFQKLLTRTMQLHATEVLNQILFYQTNKNR